MNPACCRVVSVSLPHLSPTPTHTGLRIRTEGSSSFSSSVSTLAKLVELQSRGWVGISSLVLITVVIRNSQPVSAVSAVTAPGVSGAPWPSWRRSEVPELHLMAEAPPRVDVPLHAYMKFGEKRKNNNNYTLQAIHNIPKCLWLHGCSSLCACFHKDVNYCNSFHLNKQMVSSDAVWLIALCVPGNADVPFPLGKWRLSCTDIVIIWVPFVIWIPVAKSPEPSAQSTRHVFLLHRKVRESDPSFAGCFFVQIFCHWPHFRKTTINLRVWALQNWTWEKSSKSL